MILNGAAIQAASTGYRALFRNGFEAAKPIYADFCTDVMSTGSTEVHHIPAGLAQLREWVGDRELQNLKRYVYSLVNRDWELTIGIPRNAWEDDTLGLFNAQIQAMGAMAAVHPDKLFAEMLENGHTKKGYDDVAFFHAAHPLLDSSTSSNTTDALLDADSFEDGIQSMRERTNAKGEPIDIFALGGELSLVVPPALESTGRQIVLAERLASGATNTNQNRAKLVVFNRLTSPKKWFLMLGKGPMRPFIHQMRKKAQLVAQDQPADDTVFQKKTLQYGVDGRWNQGYGMWQLAYGSDGTGT